MTLNESIVEDAALEWFGEQFRCAQTLTRPLPRGEEEKREAIRRLNPANACGNPHPASPSGRGECLFSLLCAGDLAEPMNSRALWALSSMSSLRGW